MSKISDARNAVLARDGFRCVATALDVDAGPCYDRWGQFFFSGWDPTGYRLEVDRIRDQPSQHAPPHTDVSRMVTVCSGHGRGTGPNRGRVWATRNRPLLRLYLAEKNAA